MKASDYPFPGMEHQDIRQRLADAIDKLEAWSRQTGGAVENAGKLADMLDAMVTRLRAIDVADTVPGAPTITSVTAHPTLQNNVLVNFLSPVNTGGSPITSYRVEASAGTVFGSGLTKPRRAFFYVKGDVVTFIAYASNAVGEGPGDSYEATITWDTAPGMVEDFALTPASTSIQVDWAAPLKDGGQAVSAYVVTLYDELLETVIDTITVDDLVLTATFTGLTPGTNYYVTVQAQNSVGLSSILAESPTTTLAA